MEHRRTPRRRRAWWGVGLGALAAVIAADTASAQATAPPDATGPCTANATLSDGTTIDPYASRGVYDIPRSGSADYEGQVGGGEERDERSFSGRVAIETPPLLPSIELTDAWNWEGSGTGQRDAGSVTWDLGQRLPGGLVLEVRGFHDDDGVRCEGSVEIRLEGGLGDSPVAPISAAGTALAMAGVGAAMLPRRGGAA